MASLVSDADDYVAAIGRLDDKVTHYRAALATVHKLKAEIVSDLGSNSKEKKRILSNLKHASDVLSAEDVDAVKEKLDSVEPTLTGMSDIEPRTGTFLGLVLGSINVRMSNRQERIAFKLEYESFKNRSTQFMFVYTLILMFTAPRAWADNLLHGFTLYYYAAMTVRENILIHNGSNIRSWWLSHHYLSLVLSLVQMTWPPDGTWAELRLLYLTFVLYIGLVQFLQFRYQNKRLQVLHSLGSKGEMDVASSDTPQINWTYNMLFLIPFVFLGQLFELLLSTHLLYTAYYSPSIEWQTYFVGLTFGLLGVGNVYTTAVVLKHKWQRRKGSKTSKTNGIKRSGSKNE